VVTVLLILVSGITLLPILGKLLLDRRRGRKGACMP